MGTLERGVRNVLRSPIRLVLVVAILGTSLMFVTAMFALNASAQQRLSSARDQIGTGITVSPAGSFGPFGGGGTLSGEQVKTVEGTPGVVSASEEVTEQYNESVLKGSITLPNNNRQSSSQGGAFPGASRFSDNGTLAPTIYGVTPGQSQYALINGSFAKITSGNNLTTKDSTADVALTSSALAKVNNLKVGSKFSLKGTTFTLVGLISTGSGFGDNSIMIPLATAQKVYQINGVSEVIVYAASDNQVQSLASRLKSALGSTVDVISANQFSQTLSALNAVQNNIFTTLVVAIVSAALVILFAVMLIVRERISEIALLKAIGASNWQVISQFAVEVVTLSGIAAVVAAILLIISGNTLASKFDIASGSTGGFGSGVGGPLRFAGGAALATSNQPPLSAGLSPGSFLLVLGLGIMLAVLASSIPAWYVARIKPAEVLRAD